MVHSQRKKASEFYSETIPVLAERGTFEQVFPSIEHVKVEYKELSRGGDRAQVRENPSEHLGFNRFIDCNNPACYKGGFDIQKILREMVRNRETRREFTEGCQGYEGSPKRVSTIPVLR